MFVYLNKRVKSFGYALKGIGLLLFSQAHARLHLLATIVVVCMGFYCRVTRMEWGLLVLAMIGVWVTEAINTSIELLSDRISTEYHPLTGKVKDVAAGAVLLAAIGALAIALIVFVPRFI